MFFLNITLQIQTSKHAWLQQTESKILLFLDVYLHAKNPNDQIAFSGYVGGNRLLRFDWLQVVGK